MSVSIKVRRHFRPSQRFHIYRGALDFRRADFKEVYGVAVGVSPKLAHGPAPKVFRLVTNRIEVTITELKETTTIWCAAWPHRVRERGGAEPCSGKTRVNGRELWHTNGRPRRMPSARPDLLAVMDAYKALGVDYSADPAAIRQAHKRLAKQHHPDRFPTGSAEQQQATAHMAAINDAYGLIRKAPLRNYRVSKAADPTTPRTDTEHDDAIRRMNQQVDRWMMDVEGVDRWMTVALVALLAAVVFTSGVVFFKTRAPLAFHVPQAAVRQYGRPLMGTSTKASSKKITAPELESQLIQLSDYFADAKLRCEPKATDWDYICSYTPTDSTPFLRLHFGVNVDSKGVRQTSGTVPLGVPIPPSGL